MILDIHMGDITHPFNKRDIIIGMNTKLVEASAIGRRVLVDKFATRALELGDVLTFKYDQHRHLHMVICHTIGEGGWEHADRFLRFGLDYLWQRNPQKEFSIVKVGTGSVGIRDGADPSTLHSAMASSYLPLHLFVRPEQGEAVDRAAEIAPVPLVALWSHSRGDVPIQRLAA